MRQPELVNSFSPKSVFYRPEAHVTCGNWEEMRRVRHSETNLAVLKRPLPSFSNAIAELLLHPRGEAQTLFECGMDSHLIPAMLDEELDLQSEDGLNLYEDIRFLADQFLAITKAKKSGFASRGLRPTAAACSTSIAWGCAFSPPTMGPVPNGLKIPT